jgi:hypothetical protein
MKEVSVFAIAAVLTVLVSGAVIFIIRRHFGNVLRDLTGTSERAAFWVTFTSILLVIIPLIALMFVPRWMDADAPLLFRVLAYSRWSLAAMVATMICYAFILIWFVQSKGQ